MHLCSSVGFFGAENVIVELCQQTKKTLYDVIVGVIENSYNPHLELAEEAAKRGIHTQIFACRRRLDFSTLRTIRNYIRENDIDIVHAHGYKSNFYAILCAAGLAAKVATNHLWKRNNIKSRLYCALDAVIIRFFDRIVAVSDPIRQEMIAKLVNPAKILVIYNGIDLRRFDCVRDKSALKSGTRIPKDAFVLGTVASLSPEKGHIYLFQAAQNLLKTHPKLFLFIAGDGPLRAELEKTALTLGIQNHVFFAGFRKNMPDVYAAMDVFVLPSLQEGLPMALLESMACAKPVVATDVGSVRKLIKNEKTGLLVPPANTAALVSAIGFLLDDLNRAKRMALRGFAKVREQHSAAVMTQDYIHLYDSLLPEPL